MCRKCRKEGKNFNLTLFHSHTCVHTPAVKGFMCGMCQSLTIREQRDRFRSLQCSWIIHVSLEVQVCLLQLLGNNAWVCQDFHNDNFVYHCTQMSFWTALIYIHEAELCLDGNSLFWQAYVKWWTCSYPSFKKFPSLPHLPPTWKVPRLFLFAGVLASHSEA